MQYETTLSQGRGAFCKYILSRIQSRGTNELAIAMLYNGNYINVFVIIEKQFIYLLIRS